MIVEKLGLETQQWVTNAFSWMVGGKSYLNFWILWKIYANLFNDVLHSSFFLQQIFKEQNNDFFCNSSRDWERGLRQRMLNSALMVINELLMEKSLITHIIFRLIFSFFHGFFWNLNRESECLLVNGRIFQSCAAIIYCIP